MAIQSNPPPNTLGLPSQAPSDLSGGIGPVRTSSRTPSPPATVTPQGGSSQQANTGDTFLPATRKLRSMSLASSSGSAPAAPRPRASPYGVSLRGERRTSPSSRSSKSSSSASEANKISNSQEISQSLLLKNHEGAVIDPLKTRAYALNFIHGHYAKKFPDPTWTGPKKKTPMIPVAGTFMSPTERDAEMERIREPSYRPETTAFTNRIKPLEDIGYTLRRESPMTQEVDAKFEASAQHLEQELRRGLARPANEATFLQETPYGSRYNVKMIIDGPNGKRCGMDTTWQYDKLSATGETSPFPKLVTLWPLGAVDLVAAEGK